MLFKAILCAVLLAIQALCLQEEEYYLGLYPPVGLSFEEKNKIENLLDNPEQLEDKNILEILRTALYKVFDDDFINLIIELGINVKAVNIKDKYRIFDEIKEIIWDARVVNAVMARFIAKINRIGLYNIIDCLLCFDHEIKIYKYLKIKHNNIDSDEREQEFVDILKSRLKVDDEALNWLETRALATLAKLIPALTS
jgi:hypothetical protein